VLTLNAKDPIRAEKEYKPPTPRADLSGLAGPLATSPIGRNPRTGKPVYREGGGSPRTDKLMTFLKGLDEGRPQIGDIVPGEGQVIGRSPKTGEPVYGEEPKGEIHPELLTQEFAQEQIEEQIARGNFGSMMRYTGQALQYAWETGDTSVLKGTGQFGDQSIYLTDFMLSQFTPDQVGKIIGMGYYQVEPGLWVLMDVEEPGYGMGGWEYPGYGSGAYEEKTFSKGGSSGGRGGAGGVRTRMESGQLYAGNTPRTAWRI
jgi:hypothetical protein